MSTNTDTSPYVEAYSKHGRQVRIPRETTPDLPASDVFRDVIQRTSEYCRNCFAYRYDFIGHDFYCGRLGWQRYERRYPVPKANDPDPNRELRSAGNPLCCAECGHHNGKDRGLTPNEATAHAGRLSRALAREGIAHDRETLLCVARRLAYEPGTSNAEDERVFAPAVAEAILAVN